MKVALTGDIGTGKTTLCRTLLEQFDQTTFTALILNPFLSVEELLREVLLSFGVVSKDAMRNGRLATASKHELVRTLHDVLLALKEVFRCRDSVRICRFPHGDRSKFRNSQR